MIIATLSSIRVFCLRGKCFLTVVCLFSVSHRRVWRPLYLGGLRLPGEKEGSYGLILCWQPLPGCNSSPWAQYRKKCTRAQRGTFWPLLKKILLLRVTYNNKYYLVLKFFHRFLSGNQLSWLPPNTFQFTVFTTLDLSYNKFSYPPPALGKTHQIATL